MEIESIYLDNNATTKISSQILDFLFPHLKNTYANPSSLHSAGKKAKHLLETSRLQVSSLLECKQEEIYFTSGGTESNNFAIFGCLNNVESKRNHIITTKVEHPSVLEPMKELQKKGWEITFLPVDENGQISLDYLREKITPQTLLVSIMYANNETGIIFPIEKIGKIAKKYNAIFHVDAIQIIGRQKLSLKNTNIDLLSISAHKFHSLKGAGALYIKKGIKKGIQITSLLKGGEQENTMRSGTPALHNIIAMGQACLLAEASLDKVFFIKKLRDDLESWITNNIPDTVINGKNSQRLINTTNISFIGVSAEILVWKLSQHDIYVSYGSACSSGNPEPSHVLQAMDLHWNRITSAVRFSLSIYNTQEEIEHVKKTLFFIVENLRNMP